MADSTTSEGMQPGRLLALVLVLALMWLGLVGIDRASVVVGLPALLIAALLLRFLPPVEGLGLRTAAVIRLFAGFVVDTFRGTLDLALRAVRRDPGFAPEVALWHTKLRTPLARTVFANAISLVPGTITARLDGQRLHIHLVDSSSDWRAELARLEARVAAALEPPGR